MTDRLPNGRFAPGNSLSSLGGQQRAVKLTKDELSTIARKGYEAMVNRHFNGDRAAANKWLTAKGLAAQDSEYTRFYYQFPDPGPHPARLKGDTNDPLTRS